MDKVDFWILGGCFSPVWISALGFLFLEGRKRLVRPQPIVALVRDLLGVDSGWSVGPTTIRHHTGVLISLRYDSHVQTIEVEGARLPLRPADIFQVERAIIRLRRSRRAVADAEAAAVLKRRAQEFAQQVERFADSRRTGA